MPVLRGQVAAWGGCGRGHVSHISLGARVVRTLICFRLIWVDQELEVVGYRGRIGNQLLFLTNRNPT